MTTMLLGGLWHGANWTFVVWGGLHGFFLAAERWFRRRFGGLSLMRSRATRLGAVLATYVLVNITWVFFRSPDFATAWRLLGSMTGLVADGAAILPTIRVIEVALVVSAIIAIHWSMRDRTLADLVERTPWWLTSVAWAGMLFSILVTQGGGDAFIYFQF
jgi:alginate O-acetyltransferase complex protein AlgI